MTGTLISQCNYLTFIFVLYVLQSFLLHLSIIIYFYCIFQSSFIVTISFSALIAFTSMSVILLFSLSLSPSHLPSLLSSPLPFFSSDSSNVIPGGSLVLLALALLLPPSLFPLFVIVVAFSLLKEMCKNIRLRNERNLLFYFLLLFLVLIVDY